MQLSLFSQGIISILLVIIVCVTIGVSYQDTLVIILISGMVIFLLNLGKIYYTQYENNNKLRLTNNLLPPIVRNNFVTPTNQTTLGERKENKSQPSNLEIPNEKPYHLTNTPDNIMEAETYNLEDCTTDKTCIQGADENNLFPGFDKQDKFVPPTIPEPILDDKIECHSQKKDKLVVENFTSSPLELNDVVKPFNNAVINPYKNYTMEEEIPYEEDKFVSSDDMDEQLAFHAKIGVCQGGVCKDINEMKTKDLHNIISEINSMKRIHPFSKNFPTILATNPDANY